MAQAPEFKYAPMFQVGEDTTEYYHLTSEHVSLGNFEGKEILKVTPEALTMLSNVPSQTSTSCFAVLITNV